MRYDDKGTKKGKEGRVEEFGIRRERGGKRGGITGKGRGERRESGGRWGITREEESGKRGK